MYIFKALIKADKHQQLTNSTLRPSAVQTSNFSCTELNLINLFGSTQMIKFDA